MKDSVCHIYQNENTLYFSRISITQHILSNLFINIKFMLIILLFWADMQDSEILNLFYLGGFSVWQCGEYQKETKSKVSKSIY